jgi:hypothetical protein
VNLGDHDVAISIVDRRRDRRVAMGDVAVRMGDVISQWLSVMVSVASRLAYEDERRASEWIDLGGEG